MPLGVINEPFKKEENKLPGMEEGGKTRSHEKFEKQEIDQKFIDITELL